MSWAVVCPTQDTGCTFGLASLHHVWGMCWGHCVPSAPAAGVAAVGTQGTQREATGWMQRMSRALSGPVCLVMLLVSCVLTRRTTKPGRFLRLASPRCILVWASQPAGFV